MQPPTPRTTPSPPPQQPDSDDEPDESRPRTRSPSPKWKRQRTNDGSSSSADHPPPTPPHSSRASSVVPRADFNSLPHNLRRWIILDAVNVATESVEKIGDYTRSSYEPRTLNPMLERLLVRRRVLTALATVCSFWRCCVRPLLLMGPRIVTSADELSRLAGSSYEIPGKTPIRPSLPLRGTASTYQSRRDSWTGRKRSLGSDVGKMPEVAEIVCWMTKIPWRRDNSEIRDRWPLWYIADAMRYDLEALNVRKFAAVAANQGTWWHLFRPARLTAR